MAHLVKYLGFTLFFIFIVSCFADPSNTPNSMNSLDEVHPIDIPTDTTAIVYKGSFHYTLSQCKGKFSNALHQYRPPSQPITIELNEDSVKLIRPIFLNSMEPQIHSVRDISSGQLSLFDGYWGIADEEYWDTSTGTIQLVSDGYLSGSISDITIRQRDTTCHLLLNFSGQIMDRTAG